MEQITKEEYKKKLEKFKVDVGTKNKKLLKSISFLEILLDWVDFLIEKKRISVENEKQVMVHMPAKIIYKIDEIKSLNVTSYGYDVLKKILLDETKGLINFIIKTCEIKIEDFDSLQFNLQQIFVKEEITMMMEWARLDLTKIIKKRKQEKEAEIKGSKKESVEYLKKLQEMSQKEINKLIVASMFNFFPSARTNEERKNAIKKNQKKMENSRKNAQNFALKLIDATEDAGEKAQMNVFKKIGEVRLEMERVREKFRARAKEIVSPKGPKKELKKARKRVLKAKVRMNKEKIDLIKDLSDAGKMFDKAREYMKGKRGELDGITGKKRVFIRKQAYNQLNLGKITVDKAKRHLGEEKKGADILFKQGRKYLEKAGEHMEEEKAGTEIMFKIGRGHLAKAKKHLEEEKEGLEEKQEQAREILHLMEERLKKERVRGEQWVEKEKKRIGVIEYNLQNKRRKEQKRLSLIKIGLLTRGKETAEKMKEKLRREISVPGKSDVFGKVLQKQESLNKIPQKQEIQNKFLNIKNKMESDLVKKKGLIEYDLRFKRDELKIMAETQKEAMNTKLEAFQEKQRTLINRYRAQRKANMIRTLLKAIRTMH